jgi:uncharacterized iron-regulated membrane protein
VSRAEAVPVICDVPSAATATRQRTARLFWTLLHRYAGLFIAAFLVFAGITGVALAFYKELDRTLNPALHFVRERVQEPLSVNALADKVQATYPDALISVMMLDRNPGESVRVQLSPRIDAATGKPAVLEWTEIFVDPFDGRVLGGREKGVFKADLPHLMPFLYKAHYNLYLPGKWGEWFMGIVALVWMFDCFVGFYLTLPARAGRPAKKSWLRRWMPAWLVKRNASRARLNYDLHRAGGLWVWIVLFALAMSGVFFNLRTELFRPVVNTFSPLTEEPAAFLKTLPQSAQVPVLSYEDAIASAAALRTKNAPDMQLTYVGLMPDSPGIYRVRYAEPGRGDSNWRFRYENLYIDGVTGALLYTVAYDQGSAGDKFILWQYPLHSGYIFGFWGRVLVAITGVVTVVLSVTGVIIWLRKRFRVSGTPFSRRKSSHRSL